jgi:iron complex transport system permease protein
VTPLTLKRLVVSMAGMAFFVVVAMGLGLAFGSSTIDLFDAVDQWLSGDIRNAAGSILVDARLPSVLLAALVGAALALTGAVFQGMLRNPLADPYILGVSGGASVAVVLATALGVGGTILGVSALPAAAFLGALGSVALIYGVASLLPGGLRGQQATYTLLLTGVVFNAFAMAIMLFLRTIMSPLDSQRVLFWLMGSLSPGRLQPGELLAVAACIVAGSALLIAKARTLNLLALGDDTARSLGVSAARSRLLLFLASSLVVGAAVSACGMVGFVGLVVPHSLRLVIGADHRLLVPASALGGAGFLVMADLVSRALFPLTGSTLPVGAVTAFIGVPLFFLFLIGNLRGNNP